MEECYTYNGVGITDLLVKYSKLMYAEGADRHVQFEKFAVEVRARVDFKNRPDDEGLMYLHNLMSGMSFARSPYWPSEEKE